MTTITYDKALAIIRDMVSELGTQQAAAEKLEITQQYLSDILNRRRDISDAVAHRLPPHGYRRVIFFERIYADGIGEKQK